MGFIEEVSEFAMTTTYESFPPELVDKVKNAMIDTHAVILSGYKQPCSEILIDWVRVQSGAEQSTVLGYDFKTSASLAALVNGTMGHAIDYDDVYAPLRGHPSLPIYVAVLAVSESEGKSGKDLITAYLLGVEIMTKIGTQLNPSHYLKGWHSTATMGVIGAAAAVGKLYDFTLEQFKTVIGLASSMISGIRLNFGTMAKPFHVGYAARNGIEASQLVKNGFTASHHTYDLPKGVFDLYSEEQTQINWSDQLAKPWSIMQPGFHIKKYPCCYATHRHADAAYQLISENNLDVEAIEKIECIGPVGTFVPLIYNRPKTGLQGKFSLEYVVSAMLLDRAVNLNSFTDKMVNRSSIQKLIPKVVLIEDSSIKEDRVAGNNGFVKLHIQTKDHIHEVTITHGKGSAKNPLTDEELKEKFLDCTSLVNEDNDGEYRYSLLKNLQDIQNIQSLFHHEV